jgi:hypothetical protein
MGRVAPLRKGVAPAVRISKPHQASRIAAATPFVRAIAGRYSMSRSSFWRRLNPVLRRSPSGITVKFIKYRNVQWHFAPRLTFALLIRGEGKAQSGAPMRPELAARLRPYLATYALRPETSSNSTQSRDRHRFIHYLTTCRLRKNFHAEGSLPAVFSSSQGHRPSPRLEELLEQTRLVLRRRLPAAALQELDANFPCLSKPLNPDAAQPEDWRSGRRPKDPALDVNQLAQQVIQAIDWRIIAQRERLGRA